MTIKKFRQEQNEQVWNRTGKCTIVQARHNNIEQIIEKSVKESLYRICNRKKRKEIERQVLN